MMFFKPALSNLLKLSANNHSVSKILRKNLAKCLILAQLAAIQLKKKFNKKNAHLHTVAERKE
jgi:hypothetical protein